MAEPGDPARGRGQDGRTERVGPGWRSSRSLLAPSGGRSAIPQIAWASRVLGVDPEAETDVLNARYRHLVQSYDPAKMIDLGPEFAVLAVQRLSDVTAAYRILASAHATG